MALTMSDEDERIDRYDAGMDCADSDTARRAFAELDATRAALAQAERERDEARDDAERERVRLAGCGVVAMSDTPESAARHRAKPGDYGHSASMDDVARRVDECMSLRAALAAAQAEAHDYREALENEFPADIPSGYRAHTPKAIVAVLSRAPGSREALKAWGVEVAKEVHRSLDRVLTRGAAAESNEAIVARVLGEAAHEEGGEG